MLPTRNGGSGRSFGLLANGGAGLALRPAGVFPLIPPFINYLLNIYYVPGSVLASEDEIASMLLPAKTPSCLLRLRNILPAWRKSVLTQHFANTFTLARFTLKMHVFVHFPHYRRPRYLPWFLHTSSIRTALNT